MDISNTKLTHGLLVEDFKQSILNIIMQHSLDIQSKSIVLEYINIQINKLAEQQTRQELEEYKSEQEKLENENKSKNNKKNESIFFQEYSHFIYFIFQRI